MSLEDLGGEKLQDSGYILKVKPVSLANLKRTMSVSTEPKMTPRFVDRLVKQKMRARAEAEEKAAQEVFPSDQV